MSTQLKTTDFADSHRVIHPRVVSTVLGIRIDAITMIDILNWISMRIRENSRNCQIVVVNVAKLVAARRNDVLRHAILQADIVAVDGMPLVWYSRLLPIHLPEKVSGIDIMLNMFEAADSNRWAIFFLGATTEVLELTVAKFRSTFPHARVAGYRNGYFSQGEEPRIVEAIRGSNANVLLVAISSPQKELFVEHWRNEFGVNVIHGVGGSFDVFSGKVHRAPRWMQKVGMEWFFRMAQEPTRLFLRYAITNSRFLGLVVCDLLGWLRSPKDVENLGPKSKDKDRNQ